MNLTPSQQKTIEIGNDYLNGKINKEFITISGAGGSGKTTVLKYLLEKHQDKIIYGGAISNSATTVLANNLGFGNIMTITKLLAEKQQIDKDGNQSFKTPIFANKFDIPIYNADILCIDECSMISKEKLNTILKFRGKNTKIIFIGDIAQLSVIEDGSISKTFENTIIELSEIVRSKEPLDEINDLLRKNILYYIDHEILIDEWILDGKMNFTNKFIKDSGYYNIKSKDDFIKNFIIEYNKNKENPNNAKIISYTIKEVEEYNNIIRYLLYGDTTEPYVVGENIITESPYINNGDYIPVNSFLKINGISKGFHRGIDVYIANVLFKDEIISIPILNKKIALGKYVAELKRLEYQAKKNNISWDDYYTFKNSFANVSYSYAVNSHKSQGQTFTNSFVCETSIKNTKLPSTLNKLQSLYVATTRASKNIYLY